MAALYCKINRKDFFEGMAGFVCIIFATEPNYCVYRMNVFRKLLLSKAVKTEINTKHYA